MRVCIGCFKAAEIGTQLNPCDDNAREMPWLLCSTAGYAEGDVHDGDMPVPAGHASETQVQKRTRVDFEAPAATRSHELELETVTDPVTC